jgi:hypothetical protein
MCLAWVYLHRLKRFVKYRISTMSDDDDHALIIIADWLENHELDQEGAPIVLEQLREWGVYPPDLDNLLAMDAKNRHAALIKELRPSNPEFESFSHAINPIFNDYKQANPVATISEKEFSQLLLYLDQLCEDGIWPLNLHNILDRLEENIEEIFNPDDDDNDEEEVTASASTSTTASAVGAAGVVGPIAGAVAGAAVAVASTAGAVANTTGVASASKQQSVKQKGK